MSGPPAARRGGHAGTRGGDRRTPPSWQHILRGLAGCGLALVLAGCEITGTVDIRSGTQVGANLLITGAQADCLGLTEFAGLAIKRTPDPDGSQVCRANGTVDLEQLEEFGVTVSQVGEHVMVDLNIPRRVGYVPLEVDITFPGAVLDPGGATAAGNQVKLIQNSGRGSLNTTKVVALSHPGPEWWVIGLSAGFVGGVGLTLALLCLFGHRRRLAADQGEGDVLRPPDEAGAPPPPSPPTGGPPAATPPWSVPSATVRDPDYEALFAPPSAHEPAWADPAPATSGEAEGSESGSDHRIWGPPEDRGDPID